MKQFKKFTLILSTISAMLFFMSLNSGTLFAEITGECSNCHTMHNSQGGIPMATYGGGAGPYPLLTRGDCMGCHGMGTVDRIVTINGSDFPQVLHTDALDLAGGNFAYITGAKGGGGDAMGHNVVDIGDLEDTITGLPGGINQFDHDDGGIVNYTNLTCAGANGCHGIRDAYDLSGGLAGIKGAHHRNEDGALAIADNVYNSYRFLDGVMGMENTNPADRWQNMNSTSHNEYYGESAPPVLGCGGGETSCHVGATIIVRPPNNTMSGFCGTCHGNFHTLTGTGMDDNEGIGRSGSSPFKRHPTDIVLPSTGEYSSYTSYSVEAPIGRTTVPVTPSGAVVPGSDVVTCLSCHAAHATEYPDLLRWDYTTMEAGGGSNTSGCFTCHTTKDD